MKNANSNENLFDFFLSKWLLIYIFYIFLFWYFLAGCHVGGDGPGWARLLLPGGRFRRRPRGRWWWWFMFLPSVFLVLSFLPSFVCFFFFVDWIDCGWKFPLSDKQKTNKQFVCVKETNGEDFYNSVRKKKKYHIKECTSFVIRRNLDSLGRSIIIFFFFFFSTRFFFYRLSAGWGFILFMVGDGPSRFLSYYFLATDKIPLRHWYPLCVVSCVCVCVYLLVIIAPRDWENERERCCLSAASINLSMRRIEMCVLYCVVDTQSRHDCTHQRERQKNPISLSFRFLSLFSCFIWSLMEVWMRVPITFLYFLFGCCVVIILTSFFGVEFIYICLCRRGIRTSRNGPLGPNGLLVPGPATVEPLTRPAAAWTWSEAAESTSEASATKSATCR